MNAAQGEAAIREFLAQKRIAVAGVSRNEGHHPAATVSISGTHACGG